eukprot:SAG11_NODE_10756_length_807_cov_3.737288_1_plen_24_part_01
MGLQRRVTEMVTKGRLKLLFILIG